MKKIGLSSTLFAVFFVATSLFATSAEDITQHEKVSAFFNVVNSDKKTLQDVYFRFAWDKKTNQIAIQCQNMSYDLLKLKIAVKDETTKKMVILDTLHNSNFGLENIQASTKGAVWSGSVKDINDVFSVRVWDKNGVQYNQTPISLKAQN